jgi:hypothetical protein
MGFNKRFLPELPRLMEDHARLGTVEFIRTFLKCDALCGPSESIKFVEELIKKSNQQKQN